MIKHTQGPWEFDVLGCVKTVCTFIHVPELRDPDRVANARLIASAPELLDACKKALDFALPEGTEAPEVIPPATCEWKLLRKILRAAISKAEGAE